MGVTNHTQFNLSTVKVISRYSLTVHTCYLHRYIPYFDSLARVNMFHYNLLVQQKFYKMHALLHNFFYHKVEMNILDVSYSINTVLFSNWMNGSNKNNVFTVSRSTNKKISSISRSFSSFSRTGCFYSLLKICIRHSRKFSSLEVTFCFKLRY